LWGSSERAGKSAQGKGLLCERIQNTPQAQSDCRERMRLPGVVLTALSGVRYHDLREHKEKS